MNQYNEVTKMIYQGGNQLSLNKSKESNGFKSDGWVTFLQAKQLGLKIKKGSHGVSIFRGFQEINTTDKNGKTTTENRPMGYAKVFNLDQTEKLSTEDTCVL